jgi:hypothetical protein
MDVDHKHQPHKMNILGACKKVLKPPPKKAAGIALGKLQYMMLACLPSGYQTWLASKS